MTAKPQVNEAAPPTDGDQSTPPGARIARLVAVDEKGQAWVEFDDSGRASAATLALALTRAELEALMASRTSVLVSNDAKLVAVVGKAAGPEPLLATVDGERFKLSAEKEVVLSCGKASITLRANGRVIIRGTQIESYSEGTNRIKGGQVRIN